MNLTNFGHKNRSRLAAASLLHQKDWQAVNRLDSWLQIVKHKFGCPQFKLSPRENFYFQLQPGRCIFLSE